MRAARWFAAAGVIAILTGGCSGLVSPTAPSLNTHTDVIPTAVTQEVPSPERRFISVDTLTLGEDLTTLTLAFIGARAFDPNVPCSAAYQARTEVTADVLSVGILEDQPVPSVGPCDAVGFSRTLEAKLDEPFHGSRWFDRAGYVHFLAPPPGLVELDGLPPGWGLRSGRDVEESPTGRWERTWAPPDVDDELQSVVLYQSFGGPVNVTGGDVVDAVAVGRETGTLYRWPPGGELVLVWNLGSTSLALVAHEPAFSQESVVALAESARLP